MVEELKLSRSLLFLIRYDFFIFLYILGIDVGFGVEVFVGYGGGVIGVGLWVVWKMSDRIILNYRILVLGGF